MVDIYTLSEEVDRLRNEMGRRADRDTKMFERLRLERERLRNEMSRRHRVDTDTIVSLREEVDRLKLEVEWLQTPMRKRHEALLQAAKDHLDVAGCFESEPLCEAIDACEKGDHRAHIDLCRKQVVELLEAKTKEVDHEDE